MGAVDIPDMLRLCIYISLFASFGIADSFGQAWTRPVGSVYAKVFYGESRASEQYAFDGTIQPFADNVDGDSYVDQSIYIYSEFGLSYSITLFVSAPYKRVTILDSSFRYQTSAVGSVTSGLRYNLSRLTGWSDSGNALSITALGRVPTGYTRNYAPSAGTGQVDFGLMMSYGRSFYPAPVYFQMSGGYEYRSSMYGLSSARECQTGQDLDCVLDVQPEFDDQLLYAAELGVHIADRVLLQALAGGIWSIKEPETGFSVYRPYPASQRYLKAGAGMRIRLAGSVGISGQIRFTPIGNNTINSVDYFAGIDFTFRYKKCCKKADIKKEQPEKEKESAEEPFSKPHQRQY